MQAYQLPTRYALAGGSTLANSSPSGFGRYGTIPADLNLLVGVRGQRMPFFVAYEILTGSATGQGVETAAEAIEQYRQLRTAGAGRIRVTDETGKVYTLTDLLALALPPEHRLPKDRAGA